MHSSVFSLGKRLGSLLGQNAHFLSEQEAQFPIRKKGPVRAERAHSIAKTSVLCEGKRLSPLSGQKAQSSVRANSRVLCHGKRLSHMSRQKAQYSVRANSRVVCQGKKQSSLSEKKVESFVRAKGSALPEYNVQSSVRAYRSNLWSFVSTS